MSIYPVRITEWYDGGEGTAFHGERETLKWLLPFKHCYSCGCKIRWNTGYVHHSITFGYGDAWCSNKCLKSKKEYKYMTRKEREELNELSKQVFGSSSRWQTILNKGELVYNKKMGYSEVKRMTLEEIKEIMLRQTSKPTMKEITDLITDSVKSEETKAE